MEININQIRAKQTDNRNFENPSLSSVVGGTAVGIAVRGYTKTSAKKWFRPLIINRFKSISEKMKKDEFVKINNAVAKIMEKKGLNDKCLAIKKVFDTEQSIEQCVKEVFGLRPCETANGMLGKYAYKKIKKVISEIAKGSNACFSSAANTIYVPHKGMELSVFHEIGHSMNYHFSKAGKMLQNCSHISLLSLPIVAIGLLKTKKAEGEKSEGIIDKAADFIKNNAGKLTFATFLPILAEEGMASLKGNKLAKEFLNPELANKVSKVNFIAYCTYLLGAAAAGLGAYLGIKVKDILAGKKEIIDNEKA